MYHTRYDTYILTSNFPGCSFFLAVSLLAERGKLTGSQRVLNLPWREKVMLPGDLFASFRVGCRDGSTPSAVRNGGVNLAPVWHDDFTGTGNGGEKGETRVAEL